MGAPYVGLLLRLVEHAGLACAREDKARRAAPRLLDGGPDRAPIEPDSPVAPGSHAGAIAYRNRTTMNSGTVATSSFGRFWEIPGARARPLSVGHRRIERATLEKARSLHRRGPSSSSPRKMPSRCDPVPPSLEPLGNFWLSRICSDQFRQIQRQITFTRILRPTLESRKLVIYELLSGEFWILEICASVKLTKDI